MADFTPNIAEQVIAVCQEGASETGEALSRVFEQEISVSIGEATTWKPDDLPDGFDGPGLAVVLMVEQAAAIVLIPESSGLLPDWYKDPDETGVSKLATLGQELGMLLLPEEFMPLDFKASRVDDIGAAISRGELVDDAGHVPLTLTSGEKTASLTLLWPATKPGEIIAAPPAEEPSEEAEPAAIAAGSELPTDTSSPSVGVGATAALHLPTLSPYTNSLLRIRVPVTVTLAQKRQSVSEILEIGQGTVIQFEKSCEETLQVEVGDYAIAVGETVKVGEKFGLRITSMIIPEEQFKPVQTCHS